eukprot:jgi/Chlat1/3851/Chrsp26S04154
MANVDIKVVLLGKQSVGKSCLVERYLHHKFDAAQKSTIGAAFGAKRVVTGMKTMTLGIWDTAGAERFESLSKVYYHSARAAILCFDCTDVSSFEKLKFWVQELLDAENMCKLYIAMTKCDLLSEGKPRQVSDEELRAYARKNNAKLFITSAKSGLNVEALFNTIAEDYANAPPEEQRAYAPVVRLNTESARPRETATAAARRRAANPAPRCACTS